MDLFPNEAEAECLLSGCLSDYRNSNYVHIRRAASQSNVVEIEASNNLLKLSRLKATLSMTDIFVIIAGISASAKVKWSLTS